MAIFDPIKLKWGEKNKAGDVVPVEYVIPADKVMGAIARVEEVVTLDEVTAYAQKGTMPMARLAQAYGSILRYAGAKVEDEEIYAGMFGQQATDIALAINVLLLMLVPRDHRLSMEVGDTTKGKVSKHRKGRAPSSASKRSKPQ